MSYDSQTPYEDQFIRHSKLCHRAAVAHLTPMQFMIYMTICLKTTKYNNGSVPFGSRDAEASCGVSQPKACADLDVLERKGFLVRTYKGQLTGVDHPNRASKSASSRERTAERMSSEWRVTDLPTMSGQKEIEATRDYLDWNPAAGPMVKVKVRENGKTVEVQRPAGALVEGYRDRHTPADPIPTPKRRGRPPGAKNKPKDDKVVPLRPAPKPEPRAAVAPRERPSTSYDRRPAPQPSRPQNANAAVAAMGRKRQPVYHAPQENPF